MKGTQAHHKNPTRSVAVDPEEPLPAGPSKLCYSGLADEQIIARSLPIRRDPIGVGQEEPRSNSMRKPPPTVYGGVKNRTWGDGASISSESSENAFHLSDWERKMSLLGQYGQS